MSTADKNLSTYNPGGIKDISQKRFGVVVSEWNNSITDSLYAATLETLLSHGALKQHITTHYVPGSFELSLGAQRLASQKDIDAVICLGCVIQGETRHFDFICQAVAHGLTNVGLKYDKPVIFGVLTPDNYQQALDRAGGKHGNKGDEAAISAINMLSNQ